MNGYWISNPCVGYRYQAVKGQGKMLVRDEPIASILQEALEGFASGRFETQTEIKNFLEAQPAFPKRKDGTVHYQIIKEMLTRVLYAGYITLPKWGIHLQPAKHEPIISYDTFTRIQERMNGQAKAPTRKDLDKDFPLRGFVFCGHCNSPLTSCWSRSKNKSLYPYYLCQQKGCPAKGKSIPKKAIEGDFNEIMRTVRPSRELFHLAIQMFKDLWSMRAKNQENNKASLKKQQAQIEAKIEKLVERVVECESPTLITTYENSIRKLEKDKARLVEKSASCSQALPDFNSTFRTSL